MPNPYHITATEDGNGYNITILENSNVSAYCADTAERLTEDAHGREQGRRKSYGGASAVWITAESTAPIHQA